MIGCDYCDEWFHPDCLKLSKTEVKTLTEGQWACPNCESDDGEGIFPLKYYKKTREIKYFSFSESEILLFMENILKRLREIDLFHEFFWPRHYLYLISRFV